VYEQFVRIYLEGKDAPVQIEYAVFKNILDLLRRHPNWETYVEVHHNGSIESCEAHFARMWREAVEMFGVTVTPESFVSYIVKCNFDFGETNRVSRAEAKSGGLSVKAKKSSV